MTTPQDLTHAAQALHRLYTDLDMRKTEKTGHARLARKMRPHFDSNPPASITLISLETELLDPPRPTTPPGIPAGLKPQTDQAKQSIGYRQIYIPKQGTAICAFIYTQAQAIVDKAPNAGELYTLMLEQQAYLTKKLADPNPAASIMRRSNIDPSDAWGQAAELAPLASKYTGLVIDRDRIRKWGKRGKILVRESSQGVREYNLGSIVEYAGKICG